jgi:agmatinase
VQNINSLQFLGADTHHGDLQSARYLVLPIPYEGGVSYGTGTAAAPEAVLRSSAYLELYDEVLDDEPCRHGIVTLAPARVEGDHENVHRDIYEQCKTLFTRKTVPCIIGGDHSISSPVFAALQELYPTLSCVQIDAHADLRDHYDGSRFSHASVMARIRELTPDVLQIGIRSMSREEAELVKRDNLALCTMHEFRGGGFDWRAALASLPDPLYLSFDVDALDWSVIASTGTPEPGGLSWDEAMVLLRAIFCEKTVVGCDIVELATSPTDRNSPFAAAKLLYKMIGLHAQYCLEGSAS